MIPRPVAYYLAHFESRADAASGSEPPSSDSRGDVFEQQPDGDPETAIRMAREEAFADGIATANKEWETKLAQQRQAFELRLAGERENWAQAESEKLCEKVQAAFVEIESNIAECVARILRPFVADAVRRTIIDQLAEVIGVLLRGQRSPVLKIAGPEDLLTALQERLSRFSAEFEYSCNESVDVRIASGDTLIESQLAEFAARIGANAD
jgi:hypothetical protein